MVDLVNKCINKLESESLERHSKLYNDNNPPCNPSLIVNYNIDNKYFNYYKRKFNDLWREIYINTKFVNNESNNIVKSEKELRSIKNVYESFYIIHIHYLIKIDDLRLEELLGEIKRFNDSGCYKIVFHIFYDDETYENRKQNQAKLIELINLKKDHQNNIYYLLVYGNELANKSLLLGDDKLKIYRLAMNVTALMILSSKYFSKNDYSFYCFSYNIIQKSTRVIVQTTIMELIKCMIEYEIFNRDKFIEKYKGEMKNGLTNIINEYYQKYSFDENTFDYLPNNSKLFDESDKSFKSIESLKRQFNITYHCIEKLLEIKKEEIQTRINLDTISSNILNFLLERFNFCEMLKCQSLGINLDELNKELKDNLLNNKDIEKVTYRDFIHEYCKNWVNNYIINCCFQLLKCNLNSIKIMAQKKEKWLLTICNDEILVISNNDRNNMSMSYYKNLVNTYFDSYHENIFKKLRNTNSQEELDVDLFNLLCEIFEDNDIYYYFFEEEIKKRNVESKIIDDILNMDVKKLEKSIYYSGNINDKREFINASVFLVNSKSELIESIKKINNSNVYTSSKQEGIERIDFWGVK